MMALDFCFDRKTFLEQICRACSRYYSCDGNDDEKMELFRIFDDVRTDLKSQLTAEALKSGDESTESDANEILMLREEMKEIFPEMKIWNLNIKPSDGLPQQICKDCIERFRSVKIFREECLDTQKVLESYFKDFSLLVGKSPKSEESIKIEPGVSPAPSFNPDDLVEEVPESPEHAQSPMTSPQLRHSPRFGDPPFYAESSIGTPPPLFEEIKTEPIDVQTMEFIKAEEELALALKTEDEIKEEYAGELGMKAFNSLGAAAESYCSDEESSDISDEETAIFGVDQPRSRLQCKICFDIFSKRCLLKEHQLQRHPEARPYACNLCSSTFKSNFTLSQHKLKHNRLDRKRCDLCGKFFRSQLHLQRHTKNFHLTSTYTCHICNQKFEQYTQIRFQYHVRQHGEKRFHCQYCEKSFHQKIHLINHERTHTKEQPFRCDICGKSYRQQTACHEHMLTHSDPKPFKCKICEKGFTQRSSLRLHYRLHTGNKPFRCELCGQNFAQKVQLEMHEITHSETYPGYQCEICNTKFRLLHQLTTHINMLHSTSVVGKSVSGHYVCQQCNSAFANQAHLQAHVEDVHLPKRQHSCVYCTKTFVLAAQLKAHLKTHNTHIYKTLSCQYCDKCYKSTEALDLHEEQHAEREQFKCSFCEQSFSYRTTLGQHMLSHLENQTKHDDRDDSTAYTFNSSI